MRPLLVVVLLIRVSSAGDLKTAEADFRSEDVKQIKHGGAAVLKQNDRTSVDVLVRVLRKLDKEHDRRESKFHEQMDKGSAMLAEATALISGLSTRSKSRADFAKQSSKSTKIAVEGMNIFTKALQAHLPHVTRSDVCATVLKGLNSAEAVARITEFARVERSGRVKHRLLSNLALRDGTDVGPLLVSLSTDRDPRTRALAIRGLARRSTADGGVAALTRAAQDEQWAVRRFAYQGLAAAKLSGPLMAARKREKGDDLRSVLRHLAALGEVDKPPAEKVVAFGFPVTSRRVRFVVDLSEEMEPNVIAVRRQLQLAIDALTDGTRIQIVMVGAKTRYLSKKPMTVNASSRKRISKWIHIQEAGGPANTRQLQRHLVPPYHHATRGKSAFAGLPDTVYLILGPAEESNDGDVLLGFDQWLTACPAALFVRLYATEPTADLKKYVSAAGGVLVSDR